MKRAVLAALVICSTAQADETCPRGARTTLVIQTAERKEILRPDEAIGGDVLIMRAGKHELMHAVSHDFHWLCLGYAKQRGHVVGTMSELDGVLVLRTIGYLPEDDDTLAPSAFTQERFHAYASLVSRDGRWLAFIGGRDELALYMLDTRRDRIKRLGAAPATPSSYGELDAKLWRFERDQLVVRYDSPKRSIKRFKLM